MSDAKRFVTVLEVSGCQAIEVIENAVLAVRTPFATFDIDGLETMLRKMVVPGAEAAAEEHITALIESLRAAKSLDAANGRLREICRRLDALAAAPEDTPS